MQLSSRRYGAGEPLVILHGLFGSLNNWATLCRAFAEEFEVYAVDQRNHGRSPHHPVHTFPVLADDLREFMDQHGMSSAHLLGHSMGGKTAMEVALGTPDRVKSLIVVDIAPAPYPPSHDALMEALSSVDPSAFASRGEVDAALRPQIPVERTRQFLMTNLHRTGDGRLAWRLGLEALMRNSEAMNAALRGGRRFEGPVLVVRGEASAYVRPEHLQAFTALFPAARFVTVPGAGHWVHADQPVLFAQAVFAFLRGHRSGEGRSFIPPADFVP